MVNLSFLPQRILGAIKGVDLNCVSELRLRTGYPIFLLFKGVKTYIKEDGLTLDKSAALICLESDIKETVASITERSLYAFNDKLKNGFLTTKDGVRVGVSGECVVDNEKVVTIKKISSLNIRVPHEIKNCSSVLYGKLFTKEIFNTLIISPPAKGKTTILKDLARRFNEYTDKPILIIDERGEFCTVSGENIDKITYSDKVYALSIGVRSMSPYIVITDELQTEKDWKSAEYAVSSGVKIIASCHGKTVEEVKNKEFFNDKVFMRYVVLDSDKQAGTIYGIYDEEFNLI